MKEAPSLLKPESIDLSDTVARLTLAGTVTFTAVLRLFADDITTAAQLIYGLLKVYT